MPQTKLLLLLVIVMIAAALTIYVGLSFNISPMIVALVSIGTALVARFVLSRQ